MQNTHGLPMSFDGRQQSFTSSQGGYGQPVMYAQAQQSFTQHRSFSDLNGHAQQATMGTPQIYTVCDCQTPCEAAEILLIVYPVV